MSKLVYYNNSIKEIRLPLNKEIPKEYVKGRLHKNTTTLNKHWYNNGTKEIFLNVSERIPFGYIKGRLPFKLETLDKLKNVWKKHPRQSPNKNKIMSKDQREKISKAHKNKIYINDGKISLYIDKDGEIPKNFIKGKLLSKESHKNITKQAIDRWNNLSKEERKIMMRKVSIKANETKRKNNTFNTSNPEINYYTYLQTIYNKYDIYRHYKSKLYPYYCDFYIKSINKYIELNLHWTHGGKPYDPDDIECQEKLKIWQEKAKTSQFYKNAIETWTIRDVKKRKIAEENKLNIDIIYEL